MNVDMEILLHPYVAIPIMATISIGFGALVALGVHWLLGADEFR